MRTLRFLVVIFLPFLFGAMRPHVVNDPAIVMEANDTISGDFNGDGKKEMIWIDESLMKKYGDSIRVKCSDRKIPPFGFSAMGGTLTNEGDLDENGTDDVTVTYWGEGAWCGMVVYTFRNGKWTIMIDSFSVYGPDGRTDYVTKGPGKGNATIIKQSWGDNGDFKGDTVVVKLK